MSSQSSTGAAPNADSRADVKAESLYVFDEEGVMPAFESHWK